MTRPPYRTSSHAVAPVGRAAQEPRALPPCEYARYIIRRLQVGATSPCAEFWHTLNNAQDGLRSAHQLAVLYHVAPSTFQSRFARAGLPSPRALLTNVRLLRVGQLLQNHSAEDAARRMGWDAASSMARTLRGQRAISVTQFRVSWSMPGETTWLYRTFVEPYAAAWRAFDPAAGRE